MGCASLPLLTLARHIGNRSRSSLPVLSRGIHLVVVVLLGCLPLVSGCKSIGPSSVKRDRLHYATAVSDSWKEQILLNIVKTRYGDAPAFVEIASLVSGYSLETGVSLDGQFSPESLRGDTFGAGGISAKYTDRPTISYTPLSGEAYARSLMSPVPLDGVWSVIQGGASAEFVLALTLQSLEGYRNVGLYSGQAVSSDPQFTRLLQLVRELQQASAFESEFIKQSDQLQVWFHFQPVSPTNAVLAEAVAEFKSLLGIPQDLERVRVLPGGRRADPGVIAMRARSLMQILSTLGMGVQIPTQHLTQGGIVPVAPGASPLGFTVRSCKEKPDSVFVAVPYLGYWFWIEPGDLQSKVTLAAVTVLFNFLAGGGDKGTPLLTIPTN